MEIYRLKREFFGNFTNYNVGDRFYKVTDENGRVLWENKSYPYTEERLGEIKEQLEFVCETDKPLDYFRKPIYTQEQIDDLIDMIKDCERLIELKYKP